MSRQVDGTVTQSEDLANNGDVAYFFPTDEYHRALGVVAFVGTGNFAIQGQLRAPDGNWYSYYTFSVVALGADATAPYTYAIWTGWTPCAAQRFKVINKTAGAITVKAVWRAGRSIE